MTLRTEYDAWHERVYESNRQHEDASSPWYQLLREKIGCVTGLRVLEVACGRGGFVRELARGGAHVTGCDFSFSALRVAHAKLGDATSGTSATLVHGDAHSLPFADASFDLIVSCETIEHLPDVRAAIREMHRVTRPGGKLFLTTPNYSNLTGLYELYARVRRGSPNGSTLRLSSVVSADSRLDTRRGLEDFRSGWHRPSISDPTWALSGSRGIRRIESHGAQAAQSICPSLFCCGPEESRRVTR
jgi:SAM-dependent methyltransferase